MAELIFTDMVKERGLSDRFQISSFGTSGEEEGNPIYPPAKRMLTMHGISGSHTARKISPKDIGENDYLLVMDEQNFRNLLRVAGEQNAHKIYKLCAFTETPRDIADPWYTRDFERAFLDISDGCRCFLDYVTRN